jgi:transcriptional regulator with XRE-family HTH domain
MTTITTKRSELWQRIRAARAYGKKTADQVAKACGVTRPAVSLWESKMPSNRAVPTTPHLVEIAKLCGVSPQFLLDDSVSPDDVYTYGTVDAIRSPPAVLSEVDKLGRTSKAFWSAVKFAVVSERPELDDAFDVPLTVAGVTLTVSFLHGQDLIVFGMPGVSNEGLSREVGHLLVLERAAGHPYRKRLFRWSPALTVTEPRLDPIFEIDLRSFNDVADAARAIVKL